MQAKKRLWIYSGLAVPEGAALVRRSSTSSTALTVPLLRASARKRVLLIGGRDAEHLMLPLSRLADASGVSLHVDIEPKYTARDWARGDRLMSHLSVFDPEVVLLAVDPGDMLARRCIRARVQRSKARDVWMVPSGVQSPSRAHFVAFPGPGAAGYATWAARAWVMVK